MPYQPGVTCLGHTFDSDEDRKVYFRAELKKRLKSKAFRQLPGFPIAEDEAILALSDPPYYTACPNPWLGAFISEWEAWKRTHPLNENSSHAGISAETSAAIIDDSAPTQRASHIHPDENEEVYYRKPFAADVREGRSGLFYDAHSYHTKVPHKAIMRYILHYTEPGDIVFDGFCGTGMTGVAAQMCGDREMVEALGYQMDHKGNIFDATNLNRRPEHHSKSQSGKKGPIKSTRCQKTEEKRPFSKLGPRRAILNDLSPVASFIAYNYNTPMDAELFESEANRILDEVESELGWMMETRHTDGTTIGHVHYTIWSDLFQCPQCAGEMVFWDEAVDLDKGKIRKTFPCPHCRKALKKQNMDRVRISVFDPALNRDVQVAKLVPVRINYSIPGSRQRFEKRPDAFDFDLIDKIEKGDIPYPYPTDALPDGFNTRQPKASHGITHVHHFYTKRNLWILSALREKARKSSMADSLSFLINAYDLTHSTLMTRLIFKGQYRKPVLTGYQSGTLYVSSLPVEKNILTGIRQRKISIVASSLKKIAERQVVSCGSSDTLQMPDESVDYIFVDPPFGGNIMYSELNFLLEAWQKVATNNGREAIQNNVHGKSLSDYEGLMRGCFIEAFRLLKIGRWMTVEFSNTQASVWNSIQTALIDAGFVVANVSALDKKQGSFKAVTTTTAAKQDLVISAYKPTVGFARKKFDDTITKEDLWTFVREHLRRLPDPVGEGYADDHGGSHVGAHQDGGGHPMVSERDPRILYNQVVAFFIRNGRAVPISTQAFQQELNSRFEIRDGLVFLPME